MVSRVVRPVVTGGAVSPRQPQCIVLLFHCGGVGKHCGALQQRAPAGECLRPALPRQRWARLRPALLWQRPTGGVDEMTVIEGHIPQELAARCFAKVALGRGSVTRRKTACPRLRPRDRVLPRDTRPSASPDAWHLSDGVPPPSPRHGPRAARWRSAHAITGRRDHAGV